MKEKYDDGDIFVNELEFRILKTGGCVVVKKSSFLPKNGDEKGSRRQKVKFLGSKWRRERASSPKNRFFRPKNDDEKG
ncbi:hypothetical protein ABET36_09100, partial [Caldifermentibacillus hisashii]|uniref:hypothetical protein n=1 Tax=Caldifermentibacillus hisashii TaxID=996558 RepID=UPI003D1E4BC1